jgi:putative ABC transport system permease protein
MFKNYLKIALRNIARNRISSIINVAGLAAGISACILIYLYIQREYSYDKHFADNDRIYRVTSFFNLSGQVDHFALSSFALGPALRDEFPQLEHVSQLMPVGKQTVWYNDKMYNESDVYFADSNFFKIFPYEFVKGNPATALQRPRTIVISEEMAARYFGNEDPIGKQLKFTLKSYEVTGIFHDNPLQPSHIKSQAFLALPSLDTSYAKRISSDWFYMTTFTYIKFRNASDRQGFNHKLQQFVDARIVPWIKQNQLHDSIEYRLQPLRKIHFTSDLKYDQATVGNRSYIYIFGAVGIFLLLIASINYMNMATTRATRRSKEVGIRKVMGASRQQLIWQFIGESVLTALLSLVIALLIVEILLPYFNTLAETQFSFIDIFHSSAPLFLVGAVLFVGIVGGSYPAFYLSSFRPADVIKAQQIPRGASANLRKALVVVQFSISTILIIATAIVYSQIHYMKNKDLGFNKKNLYEVNVFFLDSTLQKRFPTVENELQQNANIKGVTFAQNVPGERVGRLLFFTKNNGKQAENAFSTMFVDYNFLQMMNIPLVKGRYFSKQYGGDDTAAFIINEATARFMGWKDPIGQEIQNGVGYNGKVVGVVKDFNYTSLHSAIDPLVIMVGQKRAGSLLVRLSGNNMPATLDFIEKKWKTFDSRHPFEGNFIDEQFDKQYRKEEKMLAIFGYFAALTIIIACLGLFGLAAYMAEQKTKEIGIRKVNGASERDIVFLFVKEFMKLIGIALIIAWPLSYLLMNRWLQDFAYRISLSPVLFLVAGLIAAFIALATVSYQAISAAVRNPVQALRYE